MLEFYLVAGALVLFAGMFVLFPVLQRHENRVSRKSANIELFKERQQELEEQLTAGRIDEDAYRDLTTELQRRVLDEADIAEQSEQPDGSRSLLPALTIVAMVAALAAMMYHFTGYKPDWEITRTLETARAKVEAGGSVDAEREQLLEQLDSRLQQRPDELFYLLLKGNVEMEMNRFAEAVATFEQLMELLPDDPSVMAKALEARYFLDQGKLSPTSEALAKRILAMDPRNVRTLGLLGVHSFETGQYASAIEYWQQLLPVVGPFSPNGKMISQGIEQARAKLAEAGGDIPEEPTGGSARVEVDVALADSIDVEPGASVFVYARAADGPRMPLAVQRLTVADLPTRITLDDSMAMAPGMTLSSAGQVEIVARISKRGIANRGSGDIEGVKGPLVLKNVQGPVAVEIDQVLP